MIITDKEKEEFRKAVGKVTPIKQNNIKNSDKPKPAPVSYTHLTLPTILLV